MGPGNKLDQPAYEQTGLVEIIENLPAGLFIAADTAYVVTEHDLIPFTQEASTKIVSKTRSTSS